MKNLLVIKAFILLGLLLLVGCQPTALQPTKTHAITQSPPGAGPQAVAEVTFINNAGFLITSGDDKILIDAFHVGSPYGGSSPPEEVLHQMIQGVPPFDGIDIMLITHEHSDHFSSQYVNEFMQNNPDVILVSNKVVVDRMLSIDANLEDRMIAIELGEGETQRLVAADIELEALYIDHGIPDLVNLGFIIYLPYVNLFHSGDLSADDVSVSDVLAFEFQKKRIDVAFLPLYMFEDMEYYGHIEVGVKAKYLIPMHYSYKDQTPFWVEYDYSNAILFSDSMETWELLSETTSEAPLGEIVSFTAEDGTRIYGTLTGGGETVVILAHQGDANQTSWQSFAQSLVDEDFTALTFDFRGGGQSGGKRVIAEVVYDLNAALAFLRERGYEKIICVGASLGGTSCLRAALDDGLEGLVVFASTLSVGSPTSVHPDELAQLNIPKLFLTASDDKDFVVNDINKMYDNSPEPKELYIFHGRSEHGTDLFDTDVAEELTEVLLRFITGLVE